MIINTKGGSLNYIEENFVFLGEGREANVYRYNKDLVMKIHKKDDLNRKLDEKTVLDLSVIPTKRILMPTDVVYDEDGVMLGYLKSHKEDYSHALKYISGTKLVEELDLLKEDACLLASNGYLIGDSCRDNMIYDGISI